MRNASSDRNRGYVLGSLRKGLEVIVIDHTPMPSAALALSAPAARMDAARMDAARIAELLPLLLTAAQRISRMLGGPVRAAARAA